MAAARAMLAVRRTMSAGATLAWNSTEERYSTMALRSTFLILPAVAVLFSGCAMLSSSQESKLTCHIPRAVYPDNAKPLTRRVTVLVRALMTTSGEAQNVTVTTSSRNAAADRAAVDAMTHASCAQTGATANPFLLTQPFVFEPRREVVGAGAGDRGVAHRAVVVVDCLPARRGPSRFAASSSGLRSVSRQQVRSIGARARRSRDQKVRFFSVYPCNQYSVLVCASK
jgi:protein TonB